MNTSLDPRAIEKKKAEELCAIAKEYKDQEKARPLANVLFMLEGYAKAGKTEITFEDMIQRHSGYTGVFPMVQNRNSSVFYPDIEYQLNIPEALRSLGYEVEESSKTVVESCLIYKKIKKTRDIGWFWAIFGFDRIQEWEEEEAIQEPVELTLKKITVRWCCKEKANDTTNI